LRHFKQTPQRRIDAMRDTTVTILTEDQAQTAMAAVVDEYVVEWQTPIHYHSDAVTQIHAEIASHETAITRLNAVLVALSKPARQVWRTT
jgi:hypothetical protein